MSNINIFESLNNLIQDLNHETYNIILSIGSDHNLNQNITEFYSRMIQNFKNRHKTILILFSELKSEDFP